MNKYAKFVKDFFMIGLADVIVGASSYVLVILITKSLGANAYGIFSQANMTVQLIVPFALMGLHHSVTRYLSSQNDADILKDEFNSALFVVSICSLVIVTGLFYFANYIGLHFLDGNVSIVYLVGLMVIVSSIDSMYLTLLLPLQKMKIYSILMSADALLKVALIIVFILSNSSAYGLVLASLIARIIMTILVFFKVDVDIGRPHFNRVWEYMKYGLPMVFVSLSGWLVTAGDRYVITYFLGTASVGIYSAAYMIGNTPYVLSALLSTILIPVVSKLYDNNQRDEVLTYLNYCSKYFMALAIPFVFGTLLLGRQVLGMFTTPDIASEGSNIIPIIALATLFFGLYIIISSILVMRKRTKTIAFIWLIAGVMNIILNILVVPHLGIMGASLTTLLAYGFTMVVAWYLTTKHMKMTIDFKFIEKSLVASGIMSLIIKMINPQDTVMVIETIFCGIVIYGITLKSLGGFSKDEVRFFTGIIKREGIDIK